jgi:hypothetical protein
MTDTDRVIFRVWKGQPKTTIAFLPDAEANPGMVMAYEHIGQHGEADYEGCLLETRPAKLNDYSALLQELESLGYSLRVMQRRSWNDN